MNFYWITFAFKSKSNIQNVKLYVKSLLNEQLIGIK